MHLIAPQIDYYPSRNNKITVAKIRGHANSTRKVTGQRVSVMIDKENNFYQCASCPRAQNMSIWLTRQQCFCVHPRHLTRYKTPCDMRHIGEQPVEVSLHAVAGYVWSRPEPM